MKALSIKQPWAWLIVNGFTEFLPTGKVFQIKDIENRTWNTKFRGRFLVHASKQPDKRAVALFEDRGLNPDDLIHGAIIGSVELSDVVTESNSPWFQGPYGFVLRDPKPEVIRWQKGKLGFFDVELPQAKQEDL